MFRIKTAKKLIAYLLLAALLVTPLSAGAASIKIVSMNASAGTATVGSPISWYGATVTGGTSADTYEFMFILRLNSTSGAIVDTQTWGPDYYSYVPTQIGTYYLSVIARKATATTVISSSYLAPTITVIGTGPKIASISPSTVLVKVGTAVTWTVYNAEGGEGALGNTGTVWYEYSLYKDTNDLVATSTRASSRYTATLNAPGDYYVIVRATDNAGTSAWIGAGGVRVTAYSSAPVLSAVNVSKTVLPLGNSLTVTAKVTGGYGNYNYFWSVYNKGTLVDQMYSFDSSITYKPEFHGIYTFSCEVTDLAGNTSNKMDSVTVSVTEPKVLTIESVIPVATTVDMNSTIGWKIYVSGGIGAKVLDYTIYKDGQIYHTSTATLSASSTSTPIYCYVTEAGTYTIEVSVKDADNATDFYDKAKYIVVKDTETLTLSDLTPSVNKLTAAGTVTWTFDYHNNKGGVKTRYHILKDGVEVYTYLCGGHTFSYKITEFGVYTVALESTDLVTGYVARLSGGTVDFSLNGALTITNLQAHESPLTQGGTARWLFNVPDAKGKITVWWTVYKSGSSTPVAAGRTNSTSFTAYLKDIGDYYVAVEVMDESGRANATASGGIVTVTEAATSPMSLTKLSAEEKPVILGDPIVWKFSVKDAYGPVTIYYTIFKDGEPVTNGQLNDSNTITFTPTETGTYHVQLQARDSRGLSKMLEGGTVVVKVAENPALDVTVPTSSATVYNEGDTITWDFNVLNCTGDYTAYYAVYTAAGTCVISSATKGNSFVHKPNNPGTFYAQVQVKDDTGALSPVRTSALVTVNEIAIDPTELTVSIPTANILAVSSPSWITWTFKVSSMNEPTVNYYTVYCNYDSVIRTVAQSSTGGNSFSVYVDRPGNYYAIVQAVDEYGNTSNFGRSGFVTASMPEAAGVTPASTSLTVPFSIIGGSVTPTAATVGTPVRFAWTVVGGTATDVYVSVYNADDGTKAAYQKLPGTAGYLNFTPTAPGTYYAQVQAVDADSNTTPVATISAAVVTGASTPEPTPVPTPVPTPEPAGFHIVLSAPANGLTGSGVTSAVTIKGGTANRIYFAAYLDGSQKSYLNVSGDAATITFIPDEEGTYNLQAQAVDLGGHLTPVATAVVTVKKGFTTTVSGMPGLAGGEELSAEEALLDAAAVPAEEPAAETEKVEEAPAAEPAKVEEAPAAEPAKVEEAPAAEPAKVEEAPAAEPAKVEEAPAAEPEKVEEAPAAEPEKVEEAPAAEPEKVEEAPAAEPEKVEEAPAAEPEKVEEAPAAEPEKVEEAPAAEPEKVEEAPAAEPEKVEEAPAAEAVKAEEAPAAEPEKVEEAPAAEAVKAEEAPAAEPEKVDEAPAAEAVKAEPEPVKLGSLRVNTNLSTVGTKLTWTFTVTSGKAEKVTCYINLKGTGRVETIVLTSGTSFSYTPTQPGFYSATIEAVDAQGHSSGTITGGSVTVD